MKINSNVHALLSSLNVGDFQPEHRDHRAKLGYAPVHANTLASARKAGVIRMVWGNEQGANHTPHTHLWIERIA